MTAEDGRRLVPEAGSEDLDANSVWSKVLEAAGPDVVDDGVISEFTPTIQRLHAMSMVDGEVNNGGFNQFFFNGGGPWLDRAIEGFESVGMLGHRDVLVAVGPAAAAEEPMRSTARAANSLEAFAETSKTTKLGDFDEQWYGLPSLYEALDRFVVDHAADIWER